MKTIKIDIITLILIGIIIIAIVVGIVALYYYGNQSCIADPVAYANNNSHNYWWDNVIPIDYN